MVELGQSDPALRFSLYEPVEFIRHFLADKLEFQKVRSSVAVHVPCSSKKMGIEESFMKLAELCSEEVVPTNIPCCGMAGAFGYEAAKLPASIAMAELSLLPHLHKVAGSAFVVADGTSCRHQIADLAGRQALHSICLLDRALA